MKCLFQLHKLYTLFVSIIKQSLQRKKSYASTNQTIIAININLFVNSAKICILFLKSVWTISSKYIIV